MYLSNGARVWGHTGADPGQSTLLLFNPETEIGVVVLANRFVDIRDLIEWTFAEGIGEFSAARARKLGGAWNAYTGQQVNHSVALNVLPDYLPGGSQLYVIGNHRYLGG